MPRYDVQHVVSLTSEQKKGFAEFITNAHSTAFHAPSIFINVIFTDISERTAYIGGKERKGNHIIAHLRLGHRSREEFQQLCDKIIGSWDQLIVEPHAAEANHAAKKWELSSLIMVCLDLVGVEAGFQVPLAGQEDAWLKENYAEFQRRADKGDDKMIDVVNEIEERKLLG